MRSFFPVRNPPVSACLAKLAKNLSNRSRIMVGFVSLSIAQVSRIAIHSKLLDPHHLRLDPYKGGNIAHARKETRIYWGRPLSRPSLSEPKVMWTRQHRQLISCMRYGSSAKARSGLHAGSFPYSSNA